MSPPIIDSSHWPYVEVVYPASMTAEDLDTYRDHLEIIYARGVDWPFVCVVDTRGAPTQRATLHVRRSLVSIVDALAKRYPGSILAEAVIIEGELAASLYVAYTWLIHNKQIARRSFRDKQEAMLWAKGFLPQPNPRA